MGYPFGQKGWKLFDLETEEYFVSRDVIFHESIFPFATMVQPSESSTSSQLVEPFLHDAEPFHDAEPLQQPMTTTANHGLPWLEGRVSVPVLWTDASPGLEVGRPQHCVAPGSSSEWPSSEPINSGPDQSACRPDHDGSVSPKTPVTSDAAHPLSRPTRVSKRPLRYADYVCYSACPTDPRASQLPPLTSSHHQGASGTRYLIANSVSYTHLTLPTKRIV